MFLSWFSNYDLVYSFERASSLWNNRKEKVKKGLLMETGKNNGVSEEELEEKISEKVKKKLKTI